MVGELPFSTAEAVNISDGANTVWRAANTRADGSRYLLYSSEGDIAYFVRRFIDDILVALGLSLTFNAEVTIKQVRPTRCVLFLGVSIVGVVEVKKPGGDVLREPTVLGELLDHMLLVEGFYGMGPVIGILTTGDEWVVTWFPADQPVLEECASKSPASFSTPGTSPSRDGHGPEPQGKSRSPSSASDADSSELDRQMERVLCTTDVVSIRREPRRVLQLLRRAFQLMAIAPTHHRGKVSRCLLKLHKESSAVTFHPAACEVIPPRVDFNRFPAKNVQTLVALDDLGRGATGKAWLCVTACTKPHAAACVLKFDNRHATSEKLAHERNMWALLYPEFAAMIRLEQWSGADALVMPHFSTVREEERAQYRDALVEVLTSKFMAKGKVHKDVCWRNIGQYRHPITGQVVLVVFDLYDVVDYHVEAHGDWIGTAVTALYSE